MSIEEIKDELKLAAFPFLKNSDLRLFMSPNKKKWVLGSVTTVDCQEEK